MINRLVIVFIFLTISPWSQTADAIQSKPLHFAKGTSSATVEGSLKGDQIIDFKLGAKAGQTMRVALETSNLSNYFNVLPPGSNDAAIFIGSMSGNEWTGTLPANGENTVRVYLMRNAARRNEVADYRLMIGITGNPVATPIAQTAPPGDAMVESTPYHAMGQKPCSMGDAPQGSKQCDFGVIRGERGNAEVYVTPPGGFERVLVFAGSKVSSEGAFAVIVNKMDGWWLIDVNDYEHYQIQDAVISGG
ncbi:MAG: hypothetical protein NPIRA03_37090 [Nitrospirales bacterium]|nr:MAG: hypothetical protein NPIRA03_37090 [Nitrospirales bacterium]